MKKTFKNKVKFTVELSFSNKGINSTSERIVMGNIIDAIMNQADTVGIVPNNEEAYTTEITVTGTNGTKMKAALKSCSWGKV